MNYNYHEYVVPKSIPITVPSSSLDFAASLAVVRWQTKNNNDQTAKMDFFWSMPGLGYLKEKCISQNVKRFIHLHLYKNLYNAYNKNIYLAITLKQITTYINIQCKLKLQTNFQTLMHNGTRSQRTGHVNDIDENNLWRNETIHRKTDRIAAFVAYLYTVIRTCGMFLLVNYKSLVLFLLVHVRRRKKKKANNST